MPSRYSLLVENWKNCQRCELSAGRLNVVIAKGKLPCDVIFVGEAPGESENVIGQPFVGPAGKLLDHIIANAFGGMNLCPRCDNLQSDTERKGVYTCPKLHYTTEKGRSPKLAFTNLVACIPYTEEGKKAGQPDDEHVKACSPRLTELVDIARPVLIVCVGGLARDWLDPMKKVKVKVPQEIKQTHIDHPSYLLRQNVAVRDLSIQRAILTLQTALETCQSYKPIREEEIPF